MSKGSSKVNKAKVKVLKISADKPRCGLCGKVKNLPKTECCDNGICEDEANDKLFSYARNRGHRNHRRYPLGAYHHNEGHLGDGKTCAKCRPSFEAEI